MALCVYNTFIRAKEEFRPLIQGKVGLYLCGMTPYSFWHMGNARSFVAFDAIVRYLNFLGYEVTFVRNITDVEDKIIARARQEGIEPQEVVSRYWAACRDDMEALGLLQPSFEPRATEHIPEIQRMTEQLISRGCAYVVDGDVYYEIARFPDYGRLSGQRIGTLDAGARVEVDSRKRSPYDFDLWKESKPGEPAWDSPWGRGRPGWHIECSAMSVKYLGETFDIHGGGADLIFPHHENEIAQSEGAAGKAFARYWLHVGRLNFAGRKMAKSEGNVVLTKEMLAKYPAEAVRLYLLSHHYRTPFDFAEEELAGSTLALERYYKTLRDLGAAHPAGGTSHEVREDEMSDVERQVWLSLKDFPSRFRSAMDDDFNTAAAIGYLFDLEEAMRCFLAAGIRSRSASGIAEKARIVIREAASVLGVLGQEPKGFLSRLSEARRALVQVQPEEIEELISRRDAARKSRDYGKADEIRAYLYSKGVVLEDTVSGTVWRPK